MGYELYNGDNFNILNKLIDSGVMVDSIITDPPYGINFQSSYRTVKHKKIYNDNSMNWINDFALNCYKISKNNTAHYIFCSFHNIDIFKIAFQKYFDIKNILVWEKNNTSMGDLYGNYASKTEFILFMQKGRRNINGARSHNILRFNKTKNELHPTEKPIRLLEHLICKFTDESQVVIDPFMGSGSTGVACIKQKRNFIGIEIDNIYYEQAKKRIENEERQLFLF